MAAKLAPKLGQGLYTISEAAQYARVSPRLLSRWVFGNKSGDAIIDSQFDRNDKVVSYLDFVQTMAIREFRRQQPTIPLRKFREAARLAKSQLQMPYPFAMKNAVYWDGAEIVIVPPGGHPPRFVQASGKGRGQLLFPFVESYLDKLEFDPHTGISNLCRIFTHENVAINMRPNISFGAPLLPSGYSAACLWKAFTVEGGFAPAAKAYGVPVSEIKAAYHFYLDYLPGCAA